MWADKITTINTGRISKIQLSTFRKWSSYWGHVMPILGTPKVKIQVIDLEYLIGIWRAQIKSVPPPMHFLRADTYQVSSNARTGHPPSGQLPAGGWPGARAGWLAARVHPVSLRFMHDACMI